MFAVHTRVRQHRSEFEQSVMTITGGIAQLDGAIPE
jgi:hypothetical protein